MFFRLCWRAPRTVILLIAMGPYEPGQKHASDLLTGVGSYSGPSRGQCAALLRMLNGDWDVVNSARPGKAMRSFVFICPFLRGSIAGQRGHLIRIAEQTSGR